MFYFCICVEKKGIFERYRCLSTIEPVVEWNCVSLCPLRADWASESSPIPSTLF